MSLLVVVPAAGCAGGAASERPGPAAGDVSRPATPSPRPVGSGPGGPGSLTVALTQPQQVSGHVDSTVACMSDSRLYRASAGGTVQGYDVQLAVTARGYQGPGKYPALVTLRLVSSTAPAASMNGVSVVSRITASGGSVPLDVGIDGGRQIVGSVEWACSP